MGPSWIRGDLRCCARSEICTVTEKDVTRRVQKVEEFQRSGGGVVTDDDPSCDGVELPAFLSWANTPRPL